MKEPECTETSPEDKEDLHIVDLAQDLFENQNLEMPKRPRSHDALRKKRQEERERRHQIVLWKKPLVTLKYFLLEAFLLLEIERKK